MGEEAGGAPGKVDHVEVHLPADRGPEAHLRALVSRVDPEADWEIEGAHVAWRARQPRGAMVWEVGIGRMGPETPWLVAWKVDPEIPETWAFGALIGALVVAGFLGALGSALNLGAWLIVAALGGLLGTLRIGRILIQRALPSTAEDREELGRRVRQAVAELPEARRR